MKKINKKEFNKLPCKPRGRGNINKIALVMSKLKVYEGIILTKKEWNRKTHPSVILNNKKSYLKLHGISVNVRTLENGDFAILRIK